MRSRPGTVISVAEKIMGKFNNNDKRPQPVLPGGNPAGAAAPDRIAESTGLVDRQRTCLLAR